MKHLDNVSEVTLVSENIFPVTAPPFSGYIKVAGGTIADMGPGAPEPDAHVIDVGDNMIIPGLIDLHIHGYCGFDASSPDPNAVSALAKHLPRIGTTSFLPTIGAMPVEQIEQSIMLVRDLMANQTCAHDSQPSFAGAEVLGLHMEGPFLNPEKKGAMREEYLLKPSAELIARWLKLGKGAINRVTLAPELNGAQDVISLLVDAGVTVAAGHTMAGYQEALDSISRGIKIATHMYNAMRGFHHREPGIVGAVLTDPRVWAELICDGIHVHPAALLVVVHCKGPGRVCLVSDALAPAGLPPGTYSSLGHEVTVDEQGRTYLPDGSLAGSTATLLDGVRNMVRWTGRGLDQILPMATINPARLAGVSQTKGSLAPGKDADLVVIDDEFNVVFSMVRGKIIENTGKSS